MAELILMFVGGVAFGALAVIVLYAWTSEPLEGEVMSPNEGRGWSLWSFGPPPWVSDQSTNSWTELANQAGVDPGGPPARPLHLIQGGDPPAEEAR